MAHDKGDKPKKGKVLYQAEPGVSRRPFGFGFTRQHAGKSATAKMAKVRAAKITLNIHFEIRERGKKVRAVRKRITNVPRRLWKKAYHEAVRSAMRRNSDVAITLKRLTATF